MDDDVAKREILGSCSNEYDYQTITSHNENDSSPLIALSQTKSNGMLPNANGLSPATTLITNRSETL